MKAASQNPNLIPLQAQSRIHEAAASGDAAAVRELVSSGAADVDARDEDGCCPLHWAADRGHLQVRLEGEHSWIACMV